MEIIDNLPYIDDEYDLPGMKEQIEALIHNELKSFKFDDTEIKDQFAFPSSELSENSVFKTEQERILRKEQAQPMNLERYQVNPPQEAEEHLWLGAVENARTQQESHEARKVNLNLMCKYGVPSWKKIKEQLGNHLELLEKQMSQRKVVIDEVNKNRKFSQLQQSKEMKRRANTCKSLTEKTHQIELACAHLERELKRKRMQ
eukprot:TRINITY_DN5202_c0_g1_i2.p1 TRINITY_DN5202_c0_g1~~TRINITY_DN5202_c0_g1_i2.p1  ORF type:complete len:202 (-),score=55.91 TRINITY_DN5202_c0_g1_i2:248-853(-)